MMAWIPKEKVVVPVDTSDQSKAAVDTALELVADPTHVYIVHALPDITPTEPGVIWDAISDDSRREHAEQYLRDRFSDPKYAGLHVAIFVGNPGFTITEHAEEIGADLIVIPSHGRTGLKRLLLGSVAERVLRLAHCPVLVLRS